MTAASSKLDQSASGWHRLIRQSDAVVLLGNNFGEIIKPSGQFCANWKSVPQGQCCLAVPMVVLKRICSKYGDSATVPITLAPCTYWLIRSHPFNCACGGRRTNNRAVCNRIQTLSAINITKESSGAPDIFRSGHHDNGAIIFGGAKLRREIDQRKSESRSFALLRKLFRSGRNDIP